jgi:hypothetical protein
MIRQRKKWSAGSARVWDSRLEKIGGSTTRFGNRRRTLTSFTGPVCPGRGDLLPNPLTKPNQKEKKPSPKVPRPPLGRDLNCRNGYVCPSTFAMRAAPADDAV